MSSKIRLDIKDKFSFLNRVGVIIFICQTLKSYWKRGNRILYYLNENPTATIPELSKLWGLTRAAIRFHINNLLQDGLIEKVSQAKQSMRKRGRPIYFYKLSERVGDSNYQELCSALLKALTDKQESTQTFDLIELLADNMLPSPIFAQSLSSKMNFAMNWFEKRGYHARWEATAGGPQVKLFHCPFAALLPEHPELCRLDQLILKGILQVDVQQIARKNAQSINPRACVFRL